MKRGDLVTLSYAGRRISALVVSEPSGRDDQHIYVIAEPEARNESPVHRVYAGSCEMAGAVIGSKQYLDHEQAATRAQLEELSKSRYGRDAIAAAKLHSTMSFRRGKRVDRDQDATMMPSTGRGRLAAYDLPENPEGRQMERVMAVREATADPTDIDADAREVRYLDALRERNPRYYEAYMAMRAGMKPREIGELLQISAGAARTLVHRAKAAAAEIGAGA